MGKTAKPRPIVYLNDGYLVIKALRTFTFEDNNTSADTTNSEPVPPPHYPINARVLVRNRTYVTTSAAAADDSDDDNDDDSIHVMADSSNSSVGSYMSHKEVHSALHSVYPEFKLPSMRISSSKVEIRRPSKIKRFFKYMFSCFGCCKQRQPSDADDNTDDDDTEPPARDCKLPAWASHKVDDVTTLHVLQGDKETYIGTSHAVRYLRKRNGY